jgi:hypothetical protein
MYRVNTPEKANFVANNMSDVKSKIIENKG